jgi:hypothetical protein
MPWTLWAEIRDGHAYQYERGPERDRLPMGCTFSGDSCWAEEADANGNVVRVYMWSGGAKGFDRRLTAGPKALKA